jgi:DNA-binding XRE family transcriptional regulator
MELTKRKKLEAAGWKVGTTNDFLQLSPEEVEMIEIRLSLSRSLKQLRKDKQLSQQELAKDISSSQSRVAKMEAGDPSVSIDLLIRSLLSLGAARKDIALAISGDL